MVALLNRNARIVYEESVQPAGDPGGDILQASLVIVDLAHHPDLRLDELPLDRGSLDLHKLSGVLADSQFAQTPYFSFLCFQRDELHVAEGAQAWFRQLDLRMHGTRPPQRCFVLLMGHLLCGNTRFIRGGTKHAPGHIPCDEADNNRDHQHPDTDRSSQIFDCSNDTFFHDYHLKPLSGLAARSWRVFFGNHIPSLNGWRGLKVP